MLVEEGPDRAVSTDRLNQEFLERVNARRRVFLTATTVGGRFVLRICVLSFRTHRERMDMCLEDLRAARREALARIDRGG